MTLEINNKNIMGWLDLLFDITDDVFIKNKLGKYINRTDTKHRQKEIDELFGGDNG